MQSPLFPDTTAPYATGAMENTRCENAVSWPAIFGGVSVTVGLSLALFIFGGGMGFAAVSPWASHGLRAEHFTYLAAVWLIIVQWVSSGIGGYVTGRLRTRWTNTHTHEVFFRDTAHGLITWTTATAIGALILLFAGSIAAGHHHDAMNNEAMMDDSDTLLRNADPAAPMADKDTRAEVAHLLTKGLRDKSLPDADREYLSQLVATHSGLALPDAQTKVEQTLAQEKQNADQARKAAATVAIFSFLSMLVGAFVACAAAALGGKERDEAPLPGTVVK